MPSTYSVHLVDIELPASLIHDGWHVYHHPQRIPPRAQTRRPLMLENLALRHQLFGHSWSLATHKEDLTPEEIAKRVQEAFGAGCTS